MSLPLKYVGVLIITSVVIGMTFVFISSAVFPFMGQFLFPASCAQPVAFKNFYLNLHPIARTIMPFLNLFNANLHQRCEPSIVTNYTFSGSDADASHDFASEALALSSSCWRMLTINDLLIDEGNTMRCYMGQILRETSAEEENYEYSGIEELYLHDATSWADADNDGEYDDHHIGVLGRIEYEAQEMNFTPKLVFIRPPTPDEVEDGHDHAHYLDFTPADGQTLASIDLVHSRNPGCQGDSCEPMKYFEVVFSDWATFKRYESVLGGGQQILDFLNPGATTFRFETIVYYLNTAKRISADDDMLQPDEAGQICEPPAEYELSTGVCSDGDEPNIVLNAYSPDFPWTTYLSAAWDNIMINLAGSLVADPTNDGVPEVLGSEVDLYSTKGCGALTKSMVCCEDKVFVCVTHDLNYLSVTGDCGDGFCDWGNENGCNCPQDCTPGCADQSCDTGCGISGS